MIRLVITLLVLFLVVGVVSADTTIARTVGDGYDGRATRDTDANFATMRAASGEAFITTLSDVYNNAYLGAAVSGDGTYCLLHRYYDVFDTSAVPDDYVISSAFVGIWGIAKGNDLGTTDLYVVNATSSISTIAANDYEKAGIGEYAHIAYADYATGSYNNISLNAAGIAAISKTGNTDLVFRLGWDATGDTTGLTWGASKTALYRFYDSYGYTGVTRDPFLQIESAEAGGDTPVAAFTLQKPLYRIPGVLQVNDTSTNTPTGWNWSWGDGTWTNGTTRNATHKYTTRGTKSVYLLCSNADGSNTSASQNVRIVGYENTW